MTISILPTKTDHKILLAMSFTVLLVFLANIPVKTVERYNQRVALEQHLLFNAANIDTADRVAFGINDICRSLSPSAFSLFFNLFLLTFSYEFLRQRKNLKFAAATLCSFLSLAIFALWAYATIENNRNLTSDSLRRLPFSDFLLVDSNILDFIVCGMVLMIFFMQVSCALRFLTDIFSTEKPLK